jgi:DNA primase
MQPSEEIKSKLDIVDVLRDYIQLKPAGTSFRALCPFHREKTPSFMVSPEKQIWHCFGCGKGGDIFSFIKEIEGINFIESLRLLAPKAGVELKKIDPKISSERNKILDILDVSRKFFHDNLLEKKEAEPARGYLSERGLKEKTIAEWQIGYSTDSWNDLIIFLKTKGFRENEIFSAGLSVKKEGAQSFYNRFRRRIIFPINEVSGNTVAFSARVMPGQEETEKMGKYINSPQTAIYNKSRIIFGLDKAKLHIKKLDLAILVEGQMDVITAHQNGFKNVIASSGTALTQEQIILIKRYTNNIALAFDMDKAGEMAAERGLKTALQSEMNVKIIEVPNGKDPDDCIKNNPSEWEKAVFAAKPVIGYLIDKTAKELDLSQIENKQTAVKKILPVISDLGSKIERDFWLNKLAEKVSVNESYLLEALNQSLLAKAGGSQNQKINSASEKKEVIQEKTAREERLSELLLVFIIKFPQLLGYAISHIDPIEIVAEKNKSIYRNLIIYYNNINNSQKEESFDIFFNFKNFRFWLSQTESQNNISDSFDCGQEGSLTNFLDKLALIGDKDFYDFDYEKGKAETIKIILALKKSSLAKRMKDIEKLIREEEKRADKNLSGELLKEFKLLSDELNDLNNIYK